jgi:hypothetical protein
MVVVSENFMGKVSVIAVNREPPRGKLRYSCHQEAK